MKIVVVGASSGLGRCLGVGLARRGNQVALLARRKDRLAEAAQEAGPGSVAVQCDVTEESSVRAAVEEAALGLGGIDALIYATGVGPLGRLADLDAETWIRALSTNVVGAALVTAAALPHLQESSGVGLYLSSISASMTPPWPGLGAYITSKAALDKLVEAWRAEHPELSFTRVIVGESGGGEGGAASEFATGWDPDLAGELFPVWMARNYMSAGLLDPQQLIEAVDHVLRLAPDSSVPSITVAPRTPRAGAAPPSF